MSYVKDVLTGLAQMLSDSSIGVYKPAGTYASTERAIVFGVWPQAPDACIVLNYTPVNLGVMVPMERGILECHIRGSAGNVWDASDTAAAVRDFLQGLTGKPLGTANIVQVLHQNSVPLVQDALKRFEHVELFLLDLDTPGTPARPSAGY
jgi:hypothetical protein